MTPERPELSRFYNARACDTVWELRVPDIYLVTMRSRWSLFWWLVRLAWKGATSP